MPQYLYQVCLLGECSIHAADVKSYLIERLDELGLNGKYLQFFSSDEVSLRERKAPCAAVFMGYPGAFEETHDELDGLLEDSVLLVPIVADLTNFSECVPEKIAHYNGIGGADGWKLACTAILEHFKLLRSERRLFISYKRSETTPIAHQLYEAFDSRGYDVFLDTRSVPAGDVFQNVLWHRMADSDVVILLDSPTFHESDWTQQEYARAMASKIHIEHLLWPDVKSKNTAAFDRFVPLQLSDFKSNETVGDDARLAANVIERIVTDVESSRARALSARNLMLIDGFCDLARECGFKADLQPGHSIQLLTEDQEIAVVPMVGVPSAMRLHDLFKLANIDNPVWALFDSSGIVENVMEHINWLNDNLPMVAVPKANTRTTLEGLKK